MPNDNNLFALEAPFADVRPRPCLSSALARRGNRIRRARQTVLRLLGCGAKANARMTAVAEAHAADAGEGVQGVVAEELDELRLALNGLTCRVRNNSENIEYIAQAQRSSVDDLVSLEGTEPELE